MDVGYNQHAERFRRKNRSSASLHYPTLAPLTVKLPIDRDDDDDDDYATPMVSMSYLQGKSAPTTPRLLSRSPLGPRSRSHHRTPSVPAGSMVKSKSSSHLAGIDARPSRSGATTPRTRRKKTQPLGKIDGDWLFRAGAAMSLEAREYKGQTWLASKESSTSLAGMRDAEEEAFEEELALEAAASRRGSTALADDEASSYASRFASRSNSIPGGPRGAFSPHERPNTGDDSYFPNQDAIPCPDFVNLDEKLEELERASVVQDDEAMVRRLVRHGTNGRGSWFASITRWSLFSVDEKDEESDDESDEDDESLVDGHFSVGRNTWASRRFDGESDVPEEPISPPHKDEGGWSDAAWLLSVATKVMF